MKNANGIEPYWLSIEKGSCNPIELFVTPFQKETGRGQARFAILRALNTRIT